MPKNRDRDNLELSEVQKIRHYVMNLVYHHGEASTRILSSRELADKFCVARSTVRVALEEMTAEGYLITRKGIGTFTNPLKNFDNMKAGRIPLVGVKLGHGDQFYYDPGALETLAVVFSMLAKNNYNARLLNMGCNDAESCATELRHAYVDAVLCYGADTFYVEQASTILPTVGIFCRKIKKASTIQTNFSPAVDGFVRLLTNNCGKSQIVWHKVINDDLYNEFKRHKNIELIDVHGEQIELAAFKRIPDCIITHYNQLECIHNELKALKIPLERCKILLTSFTNVRLPFWALLDQRETACNIALESLKKMLKTPNMHIHTLLDCKIEPVNF